MSIYIHFENNQQIEIMAADKKPPGKDWYKAPDDFDWSQFYELKDGKIAEVVEEEKAKIE